jgi:hypothetical protein
LQTLFSSTCQPAADPAIVDRLAKASAYFQEKFTEILAPWLTRLAVETDNQEIRKTIGDTLTQLKTEAAVKLAGIRSCQDGFSPDRYLRAISTAAMEPPASKKRAEPIARTETDVDHPELFETLRQWRKSKAADEGVAQHRILHQKTLAAIARHLPATLAALKRIKGIGNSLAKRIGPELIAMVGDYRRAHSIAAETPSEAPTAGPPPQAAEKTYPAKSKQPPVHKPNRKRRNCPGRFGDPLSRSRKDRRE